MKYAELCCKSNCTFLTGASHPEELVQQASKLGIAGIGLTDRDGLYGMPKAYRAAKFLPAEAPVRFVTGAEITLADRPRLILLARTRAGYGLLCRILTRSRADKPKGEAGLTWEQFLADAQTPAAQGLLALQPLAEPGATGAPRPRADYETLHGLFGDRLYLPLSRHLDGWDRERTRDTLALSQRFGLSIIATNEPHYHVPERRELQDLLVAIRENVPVAEAGRKLFPNGERYLKSPDEMARLFADHPIALQNTLEVLDRCTFSPGELRYRYPSEWLPKGETGQSYLEKLVWEGAQKRYPGGIPQDVRAQLLHELKLIQELAFADYFLTIWEIIEFAREKKILCQGRGSAANSAVCYCLGITAIDPVRMNLLFERFISAERGEPPDIDVDFEHERREEVIQHIYSKYGRDRAAMVAAVITYRSRSAKRDVRKALGLGDIPGAPEQEVLADRYAEEIYGFPRHLSIHSGGFTLSADPLIETVPVEPARMEGRTIVQWDKDDLATIGLLKVDVLSLGMLSAIRKTLDLTGHALATIPPEDPATYDMIRKADTVGVFQIESRAQMSMLPRLLPRLFYDLVIELALIRPGPIVGKMIHPFLRRRRGLEPVEFPDPRLVPILGRTLGVPLFQEQIMKMAVALAAFTPGEADELRRAIGSKRASGQMDRMGKKLLDGLLANGLPQKYAEFIFQQIQGFASYGFPESHSASFALLAYASAYLKCHHPAEFTCSLLNSQPMGFYADHTLVDDARRHGVGVLPIHPNISDWDCTIENGKLRLGWRVVHGLGEQQGRRLLAERAKQKFRDLYDFVARCGLRSEILHRLALSDAFACFGWKSRDALWELLACDLLRPEPQGEQLSLFAHGGRPPSNGGPFFRPLDEYGAVCADYSSYGLSTRNHPMLILRRRLPSLPRRTAVHVKKLPSGTRATAAGLLIVRQRPATAPNVTFGTLEDESGFLDLMFRNEVYERYEEMLAHHTFLIATGRLQKDGLSVTMTVDDIKPFPQLRQEQEPEHLNQRNFH